MKMMIGQQSAKFGTNIFFRFTASSLSRFNHNTATAHTTLTSLSPRAFFLQSPLHLLTPNCLLRNFRVSGGSYWRGGTILGVSVASASVIAHAMDAGEALVDDSYNHSRDISEEEENVLKLWKLSSKIWLPILFILTVLTNLGDPIGILLVKVSLFLLSTKPSPFSVYVFVEKLCEQCMHQQTRFLNVKSLYASKVEVQDYKFLCLAAVEIRGQKFTLVGILGTWWTLPHLPSWEAFSFVRNRLLMHIGEIK